MYGFSILRFTMDVVVRDSDAVVVNTIVHLTDAVLEYLL